VLNLLKLLTSAFSRLTLAVMNPFRVLIRKIQQLFNINIITGKFITPINKKVRSLLTIKPQTKEDYFNFLGLWIYKKLIYLILLIICAGTFIYFLMYAPKIDKKVASVMAIKTSVTFDYDDVKLSSFTGLANIKNINGDIVYIGDISGGVCTGFGKLYSNSGELLYEGDFLQNKYSGKGIGYYQNGEKKYVGEYAENLYNGKGNYYSKEGSLLYDGEFKDGLYSGLGKEYNENGMLVFEGEYLAGMYHGAGTKYRDNGSIAYTGSFFNGKYQGKGTLYNKLGKPIFTGEMYGNSINYQALLSSNLADIEMAFTEIPKIYYTDEESCFAYEDAGVIISIDCPIKVYQTSVNDEVVDDDTNNQIVINGSTMSTGSSKGQDLNIAPLSFSNEEGNNSDSESQQTDDNSQTDLEVDSDADSVADSVADNSSTVELPSFIKKNIDLYFEVDTDIWQKEEELDKSKVLINRVTAFGDFNKSIIENAMELDDNSQANLEDCVAINTIRIKNATAFSNIFFEIDNGNKLTHKIWNISYAGKILRKAYQLEDVFYKLCYNENDKDSVAFFSVEKN